MPLPRPRLCLLAGAVHERRNGKNSERRTIHTRVKIYQIDLARDQNHAGFRSLEDLEKLTGKSVVDPSLYEEVFNAELDPKSLEELFIQFNSEWHPLHRGRSMSVSDVVVIEPEGIPYLVGEIKGNSPLGGSFIHRFTDLVEYNLEIESLRGQNRNFEAHDMVGLKIPAVE